MDARNKITVILGRKGTGKTTLAKQRAASVSRLFILDNLAEYREGLIFETFRDLEHYFLLEGERFRCICRFRTEEDQEALFDFIWTVGRCTLLAEECDWYAPSDKGASAAFLNLVKYGRHQEIDIIAVSRRPAEISKMLTSQADELVSFRQTEERDLDYLAHYGFKGEELQHLPDRQYVVVYN